MSLSGIKAGKAFVELEALDKTAAVLRGVERNFQAFGKRLSSIGSDALGAFGASLSSIGTKLTGLSVGMGGALAAGLIPSIKAASDSQEALNKFNAVFKEQSDAAAKFADDLAKNVGRSSTEIKNQLSAFQAFFVGLGFDPTEARELSQQIQQATLDLGSFHNLQTVSRPFLPHSRN